jgi:formate--tetrahydrofolate ligase
VVVSVNRFRGDSEADLARLLAILEGRGIAAAIADPAGSGGAGCADIARLVSQQAGQHREFRPLCPPGTDLVSQLETIVREVYGGEGVVLSEEAARRLKWLKKHGLDTLPVCIAKTQYSLSADADLKNAPTGFTVKIQDFKPAAGASFVVAIAGSILLMPGLGKVPAALAIDVVDGKITGLF